MKTLRRRLAFSLLELIMSLSMVAILLLSLYMSLGIVARAKERAAAAVAPVRTALLAADLVRQDLESVMPTSGLFAGQFVGTPLGGADILEFNCMGNDAGWNLSPTGLTQRSDADPATAPWTEGMRHVVLLLRTDVNPPMLVRQVTRNLLAPTQTEPEEEILCRNVKSFTLEYSDGLAWQDQWDSNTLGTLPSAVRMTLDALIESSKPGEEAKLYRVTRVFPLACVKPADASSSTGGAQ